MVEPRGIEPLTSRLPGRSAPGQVPKTVKDSQVTTDASAASARIRPGNGQSLGNQAGVADPVEAALARALDAATGAGEWAVVAKLADQLEARRRERAAVVDLEVERKRRQG